MEIDELKKSWKSTTGQEQPHRPVSEIIKSQSSSPLAAIRKRLKKQIIVIVISFLLILKNFSHKDIFHDLFFWCYFVAVVGIIIFFAVHYRLTGQVQNRSGQTASHITQYISTLEKNLRFYRNGITVILLFFILLSETLAYFSYEPMLIKWHSVHWAIRISVYVFLLAFKYVMGRFLYNRRYNKYISRLKAVLADLQ